jgi:hypothetical protein
MHSSASKPRRLEQAEITGAIIIQSNASAVRNVMVRMLNHYDRSGLVRSSAEVRAGEGLRFRNAHC